MASRSRRDGSGKGNIIEGYVTWRTDWVRVVSFVAACVVGAFAWWGLIVLLLIALGPRA